MPEEFDPVLFALARAMSTQRLEFGGNEGNEVDGEIDADLVASAEAEARVTIVLLEITPHIDGPGVNGGLLTVGFYDEETTGLAAFVQSHDVSGIASETELADEDMNTECYIRFNHSPRSSSTVYLHLATRPSNLSVIPTAAIILTTAATSASTSPVRIERRLTTDWRLLSNSNITVHVEAVTPYSNAWDDYVVFARMKGFTRL
jgi:ribosomal silencing factor RsfS